MYKFEQEFRKELKTTDDINFELEYRNWLEEKLEKLNFTLSELVYQVNQYSLGDIGTQDYFRYEVKMANDVIINKIQ